MNRRVTALTGLGIVLLSGYAYCVRPAKSGVRVTQKIKNFELPHRKDGRLAWKVVGSVAHILENRDMIIEMPRVHVIGVGEKPGYDITARRGTITDNRGTMNFEGDVSVASTDGASLRTDTLTWKVESQTATTKSHVTVKRRRMDMSGDGLDAQAKLNRFKIRSNVNVIFHPERADRRRKDDVSTVREEGKREDGDPVMITSEGSMTFADGVAVFVGRPNVISGTAAMTSDRLDLHLDTETDTIKKAVAEGNVTLTSEEFDARCGRAVWVPDSDDVRLFDNVVAVERGTANAVRTDLAYLRPKGRRMRCPGPAVLTFYSEKIEGEGK